MTPHARGRPGEPEPVWIECSGCGQRVPLTTPRPFRCPAAVPGDDIDHVLVRRVDPAAATFPEHPRGNPFLAFRALLSHSHRARALGIDDATLLSMITELDDAVAEVDGAGFSFTPFAEQPALAQAIGAPSIALWAKDETGNVAGSHKARHLMGVMIHLRLTEHAMLEKGPRPPLAIASCGNAALAAAVVARAARWPLRVFVPPDAERAVLERLRDLHAQVVICRRDDRPGDPCYRAFSAAVQGGALPFSVQGPDNGMAVEGGLTLGYELVEQIRRGPGRLDALVVQVGGGALGSACLQALRDAVALGALPAMPRVLTVQTEGAWPLRRAYARVVDAIVEGAPEPAPPDTEVWARRDWLRRRPADELDAALRHAATHRHAYMWPWETAPHSIAHGILDDETYDWWALVDGMLRTGGTALTVDEASLQAAQQAALTIGGTAHPPSATGTAGLAGLQALARAASLPPAADARPVVAVLLTGRRRAEPDAP